MAGIKDYSTTQADNISLNGINTAEGMLPSNLNNAIRALMKNTRDFYNDSQWVIFGDGSGAYTPAYVSGTQFTITSTGNDLTSNYHANRRIKATGTNTGTKVGTISSSAYSNNVTTVNVTWDSGVLGNDTDLEIYLAGLTATDNSIPLGVINSGNFADGSVTTAKLANDAVTNDKIADNAVQASQVNANAITEAKINANAVTTTKIADANITTAKIADNNVTTAKIPDNAITTAKINADAVNGTKIADNSIDSEHLVDGSIDSQHIGADQIITAKIADNNITTAKINNDAVTIAKIADAAIVVASEQSGHTPDDNTFYTTSASDTRFLNKDTSDLINSGQSWSASDNFIATTAAIDARVIDLVDDVGGFVPIANETSFPNVNPDVNNGVGTIVSVEALSTNYTANGSGVVTIANGTVGNSTVTLNGCGANASLPTGFGILVESTTTQHTYNFHRLTPKATEVSTVAAKSTQIGLLGTTDAVADMNTLGTSQTVSDMNTLAAISGLNSLASNSANVTTAVTNLSSINNFAEVYRISSSAPTSSLNVGDLYFDTSANELKVYKSSGWAAAGSTVNGTSARFKYTASGGQTTFTGNDDAGVSLAYDSPFIDVYLNGAKLVNGTDVTVTTGTSVVLASGATAGDIISCVAYGTFNVAAINAANITAGTLATSRGGTGLGSIGSAGQALKVNAAGNALEYGATSSAEVYGFSKNSDSQLIVTTTNQGADNISSSTFATFDDVLFSASGFTFSISNGELIATI